MWTLSKVILVSGCNYVKSFYFYSRVRADAGGISPISDFSKHTKGDEDCAGYTKYRYCVTSVYNCNYSDQNLALQSTKTIAQAELEIYWFKKHINLLFSANQWRYKSKLRELSIIQFNPHGVIVTLISDHFVLG